MKPSAFEEIQIRWVIFKANTMFSLKESLAYSLNNWGGLASTVVYMLTYLIFLSTIFGKVKLIAGYSYGEILFMTLIGQFNFYLAWVWSVTNIEKLGEDIKSGGLDLVLTKPVPSLWQVTFKKVNLFMLLFEMWPATIPLIYLIIKNLDFTVSPKGFWLGLVVFISGHVAIHCFQFVFGLTTFWTGEYRGANHLSYEIAFFGTSIPLEAYPQTFMNLGLTIAPFLIHTALTTSLVLGKTTDIRFVWMSILVMIAFLIIKNKMWKLALRQYSSASS